MKWIGQHIYDLISRFRSDVYLEDISTGTIASGGNLGLDSNNKIVKATEATGDLTSIVAGTGLSGTSLTGPIPTLNVDAEQTQITAVGIIATGQWRGTAINATYLDGQSGTNTGDETLASINALDITEVGTIDSGVWNGTAIATAYIADDAVTFAKASGVSPNVFGNVIKVLPSDFVTNDDGGVTKFGIGYVDAAGSTYGMKPTNANTELFAFVSIPEGMTATHVDIHAKQNRDIEVFEVQINADTMVSKGTGTSNTTLDITDVAATSTNLLALKITTTATSDRVFGAAVTIA